MVSKQANLNYKDMYCIETVLCEIKTSIVIHFVPEQQNMALVIECKTLDIADNTTLISATTHAQIIALK